MDDKKYIALLNNSEAFKALDAETQKKIIRAKGNDRLEYVKMFLAEQNALVAVKKELMENNESILKNFEEEVAKDKKSFLVTEETKSQGVDSEEAENLLTNI